MVELGGKATTLGIPSSLTQSLGTAGGGMPLRLAVEEGDTIAIIEAMKMEVPVKAPRAGTLHHRVKPGTQLSRLR